MFRNFKNSYSIKLIASYVMLSVISVLSLGHAYYMVMSNMLIKNNDKSMQEIVNQMARNAEIKMGEIKRFSQSFAFDPKLNYYCSKKYTPYEASAVLNEYFLPKAQTELVLANINMGVKIYVENTQIPERYYSDNDSGEENRAENYLKMKNAIGQFEIMHTSRIAETDYYKSFLNDQQYFSWNQVEKDKAGNSISLLVKLIDYSNMNYMGMMRITVSLNELFDNIDAEKANQSLFVRVLDKNKQEVFKNFSEDKLEEKCFVKTQFIQDGILEINLLTNKANLRSDMNKDLLKIMMINIFILFISVTIGVLMYKKMYKQFKNIMVGIEEFEKGNLKHYIPVKEKDELGQISLQLNGFASSMENLINDVYEVMIQKQDIEYQMLQAKVNPHFLYNILSIIKRQARAGQIDKLEEMVESTAAFYRMGLSKKTKHNTVNDEINLVKAYVEILNIQYKNTIEVEYLVEQDILNAQIPNFIIQPFVENSVKHAMIDGHLNMKIHVYTDEELLKIKIVDDGIGMDEEKVKQMFQYKQNGYGVYNVNERIHLYYHHEKCGIDISSKPGEGTTVILKLLCNEEDNLYV